MSVPSFSSFPDFLLDSRTKSADSTKTDKKEQKREEDSKHREHKHKRQNRKDRTERSKDKHRSEGRPKSERESTGLTHDDNTRLFYSDRKGDRYNMEYGGLHSGDVPRHRLVDSGRTVLGLSSAWVAHFKRGKGVEIGLRGPRKFSGLTDSRSRALLAAPPKRRLLQSGDVYKHQEIDGFLKLPSTGRQNKSEAYRSITTPKDDSDSGSESSNTSAQDEDSESESEGLTLTSYQVTMKDLDQRLAQDPTSVDDWLRLLSHTLSTIPVLSKNATTARAEITLSMLSRCFAADERNRRSKLLRFMYMKAGEELWHESKIRAEWEDALKVGGIEVWLEWLEWRIRKGAEGVDGIVNDALRILKKLGESEEDELAKVRVFWRVAVVFRNAGFSERATAIFQAQAELIFEVPQTLYGLPLDDQVAQLEEFWESEVPRIGEEGARGWAAWVSSGRKQRTTGQPAPFTSKGITDLDPYRQWAAREFDLGRTQYLPCRSFDDTQDPYSTTLFSDVQQLLLPLQHHSAKDAFRRAWLSILGLHIPGFATSLSSSGEINWDDRWSGSQLTESSYLSSLFPQENMRTRLSTEAVAGVIVGREREYESGFGPVRSWGLDVLGPLDLSVQNKKLGKGKGRTALWGPEDVAGIDEAYARRVFAQLRLGDDDVEWDVLSLAFEAALNIKNAIKASRILLSRNESLLRWVAHAQLETLNGRLDDARKVYQAVLITSRAASGLPETSLLWWNWAEMEWLAGHSEQALNVILRAVGVEGKSGTMILRGKRNLIDNIKDEDNWKYREGWIKLRALLELLTNGEPSASLGIFDEYLASEQLKSVRHESLLVGCLTMLYHYGPILKNPLAPAILRERAGKALEEYPSNSVILGLFLEGERGQGVWGRVRGILGEGGGKDKGVMRRIQDVWIAGWERGRWIGELERTRSGLAAAVESERTRGSHIIWRVYLELEIRSGQLGRAKKLFFRAIGECPLVKDLYLLAFGPLRGVFSGEELRRIGDTMVERGIRLREGLDEALVGWQDVRVEGGDKEGTSGSGDEEIEENARELRRLMPY